MFFCPLRNNSPALHPFKMVKLDHPLRGGWGVLRMTAKILLTPSSREYEGNKERMRLQGDLNLILEGYTGQGVPQGSSSIGITMPKGFIYSTRRLILRSTLWNLPICVFFRSRGTPLEISHFSHCVSSKIRNLEGDREEAGEAWKIGNSGQLLESGFLDYVVVHSSRGKKNTLSSATSPSHLSLFRREKRERNWRPASLKSEAI